MVDPRIKIEKIRKEKGWSRSQLAEKLGISVTGINNWYNEKNSMPTVWTLEDACSLFNITMVDLFSDAETDKLSAREIHFLELFQKLSPAQQDSVLAVIKSILDSNESKQ